MRLVDRRSFLAGSAAFTAAPAIAAPPPQADFDVIIVGAGAAGIAAARRVAAARRKFVVLEASDRWGGRCFTDMRTFRVPYERGARSIYTPDLNPIAKLALKARVDIYAMPTGQRLRIGLRNAREGEREDFFANLLGCTRAIAEGARGKMDLSCAQALPKDLGDWGPTMDFVLGDFGCGKSLAEISAIDFAKSAERDTAAFCRQGLGTFLAKLAFGLPIQFFSPVTRIVWGGRLVEAETRGSTLTAHAIIVTASTGVLGSGAIKFQPTLPPRYGDAIAKLRLGSYEHVAIEFAGNPLGVQSDDLVFEKAGGARTAALIANVSGSRLSFVELAGTIGSELAQDGEAAMTSFAVDWLVKLFGSDLKRAMQKTHATRWMKEPWVLGAFSAAAPGGQWARRALSDPLNDRIWFAGEAVHETMWGTVGGAWEAGERAAEGALNRVARR